MPIYVLNIHTQVPLKISLAGDTQVKSCSKREGGRGRNLECCGRDVLLQQNRQPAYPSCLVLSDSGVIMVEERAQATSPVLVKDGRTWTKAVAVMKRSGDI